MADEKKPEETKKYRILHGGVKVGAGHDGRVLQLGEQVELTALQAAHIGLEHLATEEEFSKMVAAHDAKLALEQEQAETSKKAAELGAKARGVGGLPPNFGDVRAAVKKTEPAKKPEPAKK